MKKSIWRILLVVVGHFVVFEVYSRLCVGWRESTGELCGLFFLVATLVALAWAALPAFRRVGSQGVRVLLRVVAIVVVFAGLYVGDYFYYWHVRPNIGFHEEPKWVAQHPGFQREMQAKIRANLWTTHDQEGADSIDN